MSYVPPNQPFDFGEAMIQPFRTSGGADFAKRLWFWVTIPIALALIIAVPMIAPHFGGTLVWQAEYMEAMASGAEPGAEMFSEMWAAFKPVMPGYGVMLLGMWIAAIMGEAALHRKVLLGTEFAGRPVRFGADEFRVLGAQLSVWTLIYIMMVLGLTLAIMFSALIGAVLGAVGAALAAFSMLPVFYFAIHYSVRLIPASALSVKEGSLRVLSARHISKGRFWPLFGAFLLVYIGGTIISTVITQLGYLIVFGGNPAAEAILPDADIPVIMEDAARRIKNPLVILGGVLCVVAYAALISIWFLCLSGIGTYAVRNVQGEDVTATFD